MYRSRRLLLVTCALLAVGLALQIARSGDPAPESVPDSDQLAMTADDEVSAGITRDPKPRTSSTTEEAAGGTAGAAATEAAEGTEGDVAKEPEPGIDVTLPTESFVATVTTSGVAAMAEPALGPVQHWFPNPTQFGGDRVFLVVDQTSSDEWIKVSLPVKPNGQEGWIPRDEVEITPVNHRALVDLSDDSLTVWDGDEIIVNTKAVTGKPSTPTPFGQFYVRDIIAQDNPSGAYGPYILALSGFSEVLETFNGGLPALAIHGTNNPNQIGTERSSGCVRIPNELITLLADSVPLGTPVTVAA